jgi:hypothetical protein
MHVETMLDRIEHGSFPKPRIALGPMLQGTCLVLIEAAGFAASTLLIVLGLPLFVFLFLAGWDLGLLLAQLGNLADHYASAKGPARIAFSRDLQVAFLVVAGGFTLLRLPTFIRRLCTTFEREMSHD